MKFLTLVTILVVVLVAGINARRRPRCPQGARTPTCVGERDVGAACPTAPLRRIWYYNQANRTCIAMDHQGCGGNSNRWCSLQDCQRRCTRRTTG